MYNSKILKETMEKNNLDAIIFSTKENIKYTAGYSPVSKILNPYNSYAVTIIVKEDISVVNVVQPIGEVDQILDAYSPIGKVFTYGEFYRTIPTDVTLSTKEQRLIEYSFNGNNYASGIDAIMAMIDSLNLINRRVGVDFNGFNYRQQRELERNANFQIIDAIDLIYQVRAIKTELEVKTIREGVKCFETAFKNVLNNLDNLNSEKKIVDFFCKEVIISGGNPRLPMIKVGKDAVFGQTSPNDNKVNIDSVWFDCDIEFKGYWIDMARIILSEKNTRKLELYSILKEAQREAISEIKAGMTARQVFELVMKKVHSKGFTEYKRHHVGHGIGLEPYELPVLSRDNDQIIKHGMVLSIETPYYEYGLGALHIEDQVLIRESGNEILGDLSPEIFGRREL